MWTVLKIDNKNLSILKNDFTKKLGEDVKFYIPKIKLKKFISKCKDNEDENGYVKSTFFEIKKSNKYEFISGPFTNMIFNIIEDNKLSIKGIIGNYKVTVSKDQNLFRSV